MVVLVATNNLLWDSFATKIINKMQNNPFDEISERLSRIEQELRRQAINSSKTESSNPESHFLTVIEAAAFLKLAPQTVYALTSKKKIPYLKKGKRVYFTKEQLISWMESGRKKTSDEIAAECHPILFRKGGHK